MRVDVLDLGSNTFHLLSAEVSPDGRIRTLRDEKEPVRIGERAFEVGRIPDDAFRRGIAAIGRLLAKLPAGTATGVDAVATGVFRESVNAHAFISEVRHRYGVEVEILSGEAEATLTFEGVRSEMPDVRARLAVFDLGGGSLECTLGDAARVEIARSLPLGALRLKTRFLGGDIADEDGLRRIRAAILDGAEPAVRAIRKGEPDEVAFSSGTARALLRVARRLGFVEDVPGCLGRETFHQLAMTLGSLDARAMEMLGVPPTRTDTIGTGAVILSTLVEMMRVPFVRIASRALREGIALRAGTRQEDERADSRA